ncbi:MAG: glycosyltransferase, partial [Candidatus Babeliaceae bacterium]
MNILMVTNNYTPYSGGVVSSICATTQALQEQGHTVHIATLDFGTQENDAYFVHRLYCPLKFWYYKNPVAVPWRAQAQLEVLVRTLKPALIHSHHPFLLGIAAVHVAKKYAIPIIFTHHTLYDEYSHYLPLPTFLLKPFINYVVTKYCQNVDGIIAPSSFVKNRLVHHQIQKSIAVIPSGILPLFYPGIFAPKNSIKNRKITLLTISRFMPAKNITFLLDMFAYLDHSRFQLI